MNVLERLASRLRGHAAEPVDPVRNASCTEFEVDAWQLSRFVLEKLVPVVGMHPFPLNELMLLSAAVCRLRPIQIYEWGTHIGKSARAFHEITTHFRIPCVIHSVDLPDDVDHVEHPSQERGRMVRGLEGISLHQGDGVDISLSLWRDAGRLAPVLFLVDGDHSKESVYRELAAIVAEVPAPGIVVHDSFYQSPDSNYNIGPHDAIAQILREAPGRFKRIDSGLGLPGMTHLFPV